MKLIEILSPYDLDQLLEEARVDRKHDAVFKIICEKKRRRLKQEEMDRDIINKVKELGE